MLGWFRRQARSVSSAALVSLAALTICSATPHRDDCHGAECDHALPHDPSQHAVERAAESGEQPLHCVLCHASRLARVSEPAYAFAQATGQSFRAWHPASNARTHVFSTQPPLRGPPSLG
jgi:hypothetical protein